jgi:GNAT superfamily N-acetyltransferase
MNNQEIATSPLSLENWRDFASLMSGDAQCNECWCLNHHLPPGCPTGLTAQKKKFELVSQSLATGLLAYSENRCVGWIAIDPLAELTGHDCSAEAEQGQWTIHCIFVKDGFRGLGVSRALIQAAIHFAKQHGAEILTAFPIPQESIGKYPAHEAEFSGRLSTYTKLGFEEGKVLSPFYQRVKLRL